MYHIEGNATPAAVFLKTAKIEGTMVHFFLPNYTLYNLSNRSFLCGRYSAVLVEFFGP